jgi:hypothetical protein
VVLAHAFLLVPERTAPGRRARGGGCPRARVGCCGCATGRVRAAAEQVADAEERTMLLADLETI